MPLPNLMDVTQPAPEAQASPPTGSSRVPPGDFICWTNANRKRLIALGIFTVILAAIFVRPLSSLFRLSTHDELYSHLLLIPFISGYLIWLRKGALTIDSRPSRGFAVFPFLAGSAFIMGYKWAVLSGWKPALSDYIAVFTTAFLCFFCAGTVLALGQKTVRTFRFALAFLFWMVPFPGMVLNRLETLLQYGSADAAFAMLKLSGMPVLRDGLDFHLPGFSMHVAPECSGIHSSLALLITSVLTAYMLLQSPWSKAVFVLAVIPLAILRNGFRIFVLGQLCVQVNPNWIHSDLHRRGGPIFFVLSLIPFFLLLCWLRKVELRIGRKTSTTERPKNSGETI